MKIRFRRQFKYMVDNATELTIERGEYEVPRQVSKDVANLAIQFGAAVVIPDAPKKVAKKKAPENKVLEVEEDK